jgi:hypothetical protein
MCKIENFIDRVNEIDEKFYFILSGLNQLSYMKCGLSRKHAECSLYAPAAMQMMPP